MPINLLLSSHSFIWYPSIDPSIHPSFHWHPPSKQSTNHPSTHLSIHSSIHQSTHPSINPPTQASTWYSTRAQEMPMWGQIEYEPAPAYYVISRASSEWNKREALYDDCAEGLTVLDFWEFDFFSINSAIDSIEQQMAPSYNKIIHTRPILWELFILYSHYSRTFFFYFSQKKRKASIIHGQFYQIDVIGLSHTSPFSTRVFVIMHVYACIFKTLFVGHYLFIIHHYLFNIVKK